MNMNVQLLKRVETWLRQLKHQQHFDMDSYVDRNDCGTSFCIAGKALELSGYKVRTDGMLVNPDGNPSFDPAVKAGKLLGLTKIKRERLFFINMWPLKFRNLFIEANAFQLPLERIVAADRIKYLIEKGK